MKKNLMRLFLGFLLIISCLAAADFRTQANSGSEKSFSELSDLTLKVVDLSAQLSKENEFSRAEFENSASERFAKLERLAEKNPSEILRVALPPDVLAKIPRDLQSFFERNIDLEGEIEVVYECDGETETLKYFLKTEKERLPVYFSKESNSELKTGSRVRIRGVRVGDIIAAEECVTVGSLPLPESIAAGAFGEQKVLVLLVNFQNDTRTPFTV